LLVITALAGVLGWSSNHTIARVFDEAAKLLSGTGQPAPPNPFLLKPALSPLSNLVVYVPLIGALLALVLGHLSIVDDESNGLGRLLFSRQVTRTQYAFGKVLSSAAVLVVVLVGSLLVSVVSLLVVNGSVAVADLGRLAGFYALSWLYLMLFALVGMVTALITRTRSLGLLSAMGVWLVITFAVPQFTSGLRPTQSLNPITEPLGTSQRLFQITAHAQPYSVVEQYKAAAGVVLNTGAAESVGATIVRILPVAGLSFILLLATLRLIQRHDFSRSASHE
jgi:ABC-type transport system involved in multi-copper enzyme maturation permease subunit